MQTVFRLYLIVEFVVHIACMYLAHVVYVNYKHRQPSDSGSWYYRFDGSTDGQEMTTRVQPPTIGPFQGQGVRIG